MTRDSILVCPARGFVRSGHSSGEPLLHPHHTWQDGLCVKMQDDLCVKMHNVKMHLCVKVHNVKMHNDRQDGLCVKMHKRCQVVMSSWGPKLVVSSWGPTSQASHEQLVAH